MIVKDFSDGKDCIQLGSGHKDLKLKTRGDDVYVYQRKDLMAIVEDAAGDLTQGKISCLTKSFLVLSQCQLSKIINI